MQVRFHFKIEISTWVCIWNDISAYSGLPFIGVISKKVVFIVFLLMILQSKFCISTGVLLLSSSLLLILPSLVSFEAPKYTPDSGNRHRIRHAFQRVKILHDSKIPQNDHRRYLFWYFNDNSLLRVLVIVPEPNCYCCFPYWALGKIFASGFRVWFIKLLKKRRRCELYLPNNHPFSLFWHFNDADFLPAFARVGD